MWVKRTRFDLAREDLDGAAGVLADGGPRVDDGLRPEVARGPAHRGKLERGDREARGPPLERGLDLELAARLEAVIEQRVGLDHRGEVREGDGGVAVSGRPVPDETRLGGLVDGDIVLATTRSDLLLRQLQELFHGAAGGEEVIEPHLRAAIPGLEVDHPHVGAAALEEGLEARERTAHRPLLGDVRVEGKVDPPAVEGDRFPVGERGLPPWGPVPRQLQTPRSAIAARPRETAASAFRAPWVMKSGRRVREPGPHVRGNVDGHVRAGGRLVLERLPAGECGARRAAPGRGRLAPDAPDGDEECGGHGPGAGRSQAREAPSGS